MRVKATVALALMICAAALMATTGTEGDPFAAVPADKRESLKTCISEYVENNRTQNWSKLYDLVSDTGRGGTTREMFVEHMKQAHGLSFANYPDLLEFVLARADKSEDGGFDLYGCAEARREGEKYSGIAVVHAVFERESWFFTGWSFDGMASGSCSAMKKDDWQPFMRLHWNHMMEELR